MKTSIRKFLLIYLLLAIGITTTLTAIGNYFIDQEDIQEHLDTLMATSGLAYEALLTKDPSQQTLNEIQSGLAGIPHRINDYLPSLEAKQPALKAYANRFSFQLWSADNTRLLHSPNAPSIAPDELSAGFSNAYINQKKWRIFSASNPSSGSKLALTERYDTRNELRRRIARDDLYIMLFMFPLSGFLMWIIIGRGLASLDKIAKEVSDREPFHLEPVNIEYAPEEIKPVVDELNKLFFRLQEGFEREKRFPDNAAHELKTPLAAIKTQAQVALNTHDIKEKDTAIQKIIASVNRSTHIVQQLLIMSRLVSSTEDPSWLEPINLVYVARDMLAILAPKAIEKQIELELEADENIPNFQGNATTLCILVRNLVDNAIRYTPNHGEVIVRIKALTDQIKLEITDSGPGIPDNLKDRVFERFFRIIGTKSTGSGLGLAIVKQIADLHHASIELDTPKTGPGLIVRVYFPCES